MKNDLIQARIEKRYFLKMTTSKVRKRKPEKKPPVFADAVSKGIVDFFKEMGYTTNRKIL